MFDTLDPVNPDELVGIWRGDEIATGHPMDGLLGAMGWFGKEFRGKDEVYPLLMAGSHGETFSINPGLLPLSVFMSAPRALIKVLFSVVSPLVHTRKGRASLCVQEFHGKRTAAMRYDQKPIIDAFARFGDDSVLGVTDFGRMSTRNYFFTLTKVAAQEARGGLICAHASPGTQVLRYPDMERLIE